MDTIVEVYRHVGVKVRTDLLKRNVPGGRMATLNARFDAIDAATNAVDEPGTEVQYNVLGNLHQSCFTHACIYSAGIAGERGIFTDEHGLPSLKCSTHILHTCIFNYKSRQAGPLYPSVCPKPPV